MKKILRALIIFPIKLYQWLLSPLLGRNCRFNPSCSNYMIQAIEEWGVLKGIGLGLKRIMKCHPWGGQGFDPVPRRRTKDIKG